MWWASDAPSTQTYIKDTSQWNPWVTAHEGGGITNTLLKIYTYNMKILYLESVLFTISPCEVSNCCL